MKQLITITLISFTVWLSVHGQEIEAILKADDLSSFQRIEIKDSLMLHKAIDTEAQQIANYLVENGADVNGFNEDGYTPLHLAVNKGNAKMVTELLNAGSNPNQKRNGGIGGTALMYAAAANNVSLINTLSETGAIVDLGDNNEDHALNWATYYGHLDAMQALIRHGSDLSKKSKHGAAVDVGLRLWHTDTVMQVFRASGFYGKEGRSDKVWKAIKEGASLERFNQLDPDGKDILGSSYLHLAAEYGHLDQVAFLLNAGADVNILNRVGQCPLAIAARFGHTEVVKILLEAGADPNGAGEKYQLRPMIGAAIGGNQQITQLLLEEGAEIDHQDVINEAAAIHWSIMYNHKGLVKLLLNEGAAFEQPIFDGQMTASSLAEAMGLKDIVQLIEGKRADKNLISGSWALKEMSFILSDTTISFTVGSPGALVVSPMRYAIMYTPLKDERVPFENLSQPTDAETLAGFRSIVFNTGTYQVSDNVFTTTADIAKVPGFEGGVQFYRYEIKQDELTFTLFDETYPNGTKPSWYGKVEVQMLFSRE